MLMSVVNVAIVPQYTTAAHCGKSICDRLSAVQAKLFDGKKDNGEEKQ